MKALSRYTATRAIESSKQQWTAHTFRLHLRVFPAARPITVFVKGARCRVNVRYHDLDQVELHAQLYNAFGLRFVTQQDEAGIYIVVKRRRLLGLISRADFLLKVPSYANLTFNLTQGAVRVDDLNGVLELPPLLDQIPVSIPQIPAGD